MHDHQKLEIVTRERDRLQAEVNGLYEAYERTMMAVMGKPQRDAVHKIVDLERKLEKAEARVEKLRGIIHGVHGPLYGQGLKDAFDSACDWLTSLRPLGGRYTVFELQEFDQRLAALKASADL